VIAVRNWFPHGCMAPNGCDDPHCWLCTVVAELPQPTFNDDRRRGDEGTRDGTAEQKGGDNLAFKKRHRVGPHR
jgi:hypothetical protein